jgi:hypothetical protein
VQNLHKQPAIAILLIELSVLQVFVLLYFSRMRTAFKYAGHFFAGCMDFAAGVLVVSVVGAVCGVEVPLWAYPLGAFLAVLPDMDIILPVLRASNLLGWDHHQTIMHRPVLVLPTVALLGAVIGFALGNPAFYSLLFFLCVFWHYVHDTRGFGGGGIAWFWPVSRFYWGLFGGEVPEDVRDRDTPFYFEWLSPTSLSVREFFLAALFLLAAPMFDQALVPWVTLLEPLFIFSALLLWSLAPVYGPRKSN